MLLHRLIAGVFLFLPSPKNAVAAQDNYFIFMMLIVIVFKFFFNLHIAGWLLLSFFLVYYFSDALPHRSIGGVLPHKENSAHHCSGLL